MSTPSSASEQRRSTGAGPRRSEAATDQGEIGGIRCTDSADLRSPSRRRPVGPGGGDERKRRPWVGLRGRNCRAFSETPRACPGVLLLPFTA
jgi:hypothetical protein